MPTFRDPLTDAAEASEAMRGLAHASRVFDDPADTYTVFGDLTATMRSLRQVLDQLANTHLAHRDRAQHDDGDHLAGTAPRSLPPTSCTEPGPCSTRPTTTSTPRSPTPGESRGTPSQSWIETLPVNDWPRASMATPRPRPCRPGHSR